MIEKYFFLFFPIFFIGLWMGVTFILSLLGWRKLQKEFKYAGTPHGSRIGIISARIGWTDYNNCLVLRTTNEGMFLNVLIFFRLFHPPLFIPWKAIRSVKFEQFLFIKTVSMDLGGTRIRLRRVTYEQIQHHLEAINQLNSW